MHGDKCMERLHLDVGTLRLLANSLGCVEIDVSSVAALRARAYDLETSVRKAYSEAVARISQNPVIIDGLVTHAEEVHAMLLVMHGHPMDVNEKLQTQLQGSLLKRQSLQRSLQTLDGVAAGLQVLVNVRSLLTSCSRSMDAGELHLAVVEECATHRHLDILRGLLDREEESPLVEQVGAIAAACKRRLKGEALETWNELALGTGLLQQAASVSQPQWRPQPSQPQWQPQPSQPQPPCSQRLLLRSSGHGVALRQLLYTLAKLVELDACVERLGQWLLAQLLRPLVVAPGAAKLRISLLDATCLCKDVTSEVAPTPPAAAAESAVATAAKEPLSALQELEALCEAFESCACALLGFFEQHCGDCDGDCGHADADRNAKAVVDAALITRLAAIAGHMGQTAWPAAAQMVCDACSALLMPKGGNVGLESAQEDEGAKVASRAALLEKRVTMAGRRQGLRLHSFAARLHAHAASRRANALLDSARVLLRSRCVESGPLAIVPIDERLGGISHAEPRVVFDRSQCSRSALGLAKWQRDAVKLACMSDTAGAELLCSRTRDMLDMSTAVLLAAHAARSSLVVTGGTSAHNALGGLVPHTALFTHNDCQLLVHACLSLCAEYVTALPTEAVSGEATLVDLALAFRWVATQQLCAASDAMLGQQRPYLTCVRGFVGDGPAGRPGLGAGEVGAAHVAAKQALKQLLHALRSLRGCDSDGRGDVSWVLPERRLLGALVEVSVRAMAGACLLPNHISDADSTVLYTLLHPLLGAAVAATAAGVGRGAWNGNGIRGSSRRPRLGASAGMGAGLGFGVSWCEGDDVEGGEGGGEEGGKEGAAQLQREHAELLAPSLAKLRQLLLALNAEFGRIRELHCAGELRMLAPQELLSLLNALFDCTALCCK